MSIFKHFILFFLTAFSLVPVEDNGWFPVEKAPKAEEEPLERDPSIWILFSKTIDLEKILVRFPEDPAYRYTESGAFEIRSEKEGEIFELTVEPVAKSQFGSESTTLYQSEGRWVHVHVLQTKHNMYCFRTYSDQPECPNHKTFVSSFTLQ